MVKFKPKKNGIPFILTKEKSTNFYLTFSHFPETNEKNRFFTIAFFYFFTPPTSDTIYQKLQPKGYFFTVMLIFLHMVALIRLNEAL